MGKTALYFAENRHITDSPKPVKIPAPARRPHDIATNTSILSAFKGLGTLTSAEEPAYKEHVVLADLFG